MKTHKHQWLLNHLPLSAIPPLFDHTQIDLLLVCDMTPLQLTPPAKAVPPRRDVAGDVTLWVGAAGGRSRLRRQGMRDEANIRHDS
jgi:hypothetical protein